MTNSQVTMNCVNLLQKPVVVANAAAAISVIDVVAILTSSS